MGVFAVGHGIFVQIRLDFLNHLHLSTLFVEGDGVGVAGSKENLEHFKGISVESVAWNLTFSVY